MPQSTAGLTRYFDEEMGGIKITPEQVVIASVVIIVMELMLKFSVI
jgi:preprotein translocase subunit Sec61beta